MGISKELSRALEIARKDHELDSREEFVRYALALLLEDRLRIRTIQAIFKARGQVRRRRTVPLERLS